MKVWVAYVLNGEWILEEVEEESGDSKDKCMERVNDSRGWEWVFYDRWEAINFYRRRAVER